MGIRRRAREQSLQFLYQIELKYGSFDISNLENELEQFWGYRDKPVDDDILEFSNLINVGTIENRDSIDALISSYSANWKISRISKIDKQILRMAIFELIYLHDVPKSVVINEAIEIAKKYGSEESSSFINGILDSIKNDLTKGES
jgi:transcription antitermination protein NusB